jgi:hypothetical protein
MDDERLPFDTIRPDFVVNHFLEDGVLMFRVHLIYLAQGATQMHRFHGYLTDPGIMAFLGNLRRPFQAFAAARKQEFADPTLGGQLAHVLSRVLGTAKGLAEDVRLVVLAPALETIDQKLPEIDLALVLAGREGGGRFVFDRARI